MLMDEFDFEELIADMFGITDEQREDETYVEEVFYREFGFELVDAYAFAKRLIKHTVPVEAGLSGKAYHAFVSTTQPFMLMKTEANK